MKKPKHLTKKQFEELISLKNYMLDLKGFLERIKKESDKINNIEDKTINKSIIKI